MSHSSASYVKSTQRNDGGKNSDCKIKEMIFQIIKNAFHALSTQDSMKTQSVAEALRVANHMADSRSIAPS